MSRIALIAALAALALSPLAALAEKDPVLAALENPQGERAIHEAVPRETVYHGPYVEGAPDLIVGYNVGYRVAWEAAVGKCGSEVLVENTKAWCGDHCSTGNGDRLNRRGYRQTRHRRPL